MFHHALFRTALRASVLALAVLSPASPQTGGFGGPASLGSAEPSGDGALPSIRPWLNLGGMYTRNLSGVDASAAAFRNTTGYYSATVSGGVVGSKALERGSVAAGYAIGSAFNNSHSANGVSQTGTLQFDHMFTERSAIGVRALGGSSYGGYGYGSGFGGIWGIAPASGIWSSSLAATPGGSGMLLQDPADNGLVDGEAFDTRASFGSVNASYLYNFSQRVSAIVGGGGGVVRRSGKGLPGLNTGGASAQINYRFTQRLFVGGYYGYGQFTYPGLFGGNDIHSAGVIMGYTLGKRSSVEFSARAFRFHSSYVGSVAIDPEIAAILGVASVSEVKDVTRYGPEVGVGYNYRFPVGNLMLRYNRGFNPGNGAVLASTRDNILASYGFGNRRVSAGIHSSIQRYRSLTRLGGDQDLRQLSGSVSTRFWRGLYFTTAGGIRNIQLGVQPSRYQAFATVGISITPGSFPLGF